MKNIFFWCLTVFILLAGLNSFSQTFVQCKGIGWGYHGTNKNLIGFGYGLSKKTPLISERYNILFSGDPEFEEVNKPILGLVFDYNIGRIFCGGINLNMYTKTYMLDIGIMPNIGIGFPYLFSITYGYNILVMNMIDESKNRHSVNVQITMPLKIEEIGDFRKQRILFGTVRVFGK